MNTKEFDKSSFSFTPSKQLKTYVKVLISIATPITEQQHAITNS